MTAFIGFFAGVNTQGQALGPIGRMGAGMQYGPPLLGLHPAAPQHLQGFILVHMRYK